uniref:Uncharacterized protein n=1 Tax=Rhizophora mucronata TaxID=61149 RepID=A0A2P2QF91_RHIMU
MHRCVYQYEQLSSNLDQVRYL